MAPRLIPATGDDPMKAFQPWMVVFGLLVLGTLTGCQSDRVLAERDELYKQNQALQSRQQQSQQQIDALQAERDGLSQELQRVQSQPAPQPQPATQPGSKPAGANVDFGGIDNVEVIAEPTRITVRIPGDVLFESGKADIRSSARKTLDSVASVIKAKYSGKTIRIEGYTDTDAIKKSAWKDNLELSMARAASVHRYLQGKGMSPSKMYAAGFGSAKPQATKAKSRRVEIVVVLQER